jgi:arylsulfatase A-like enzyme
MTRRRFLGHSAAALAGAPAVLAADRRPNIILCMGDDHGWYETAYNGHPYLRTPVLDDMAATGLRFDRFYSAAPVCSPTRGSVMTGRHPNRYGTFSANWSMRPEEITVAQILRKSGYACGHFGKWHLGPVKADSPTSPGAMGFEEWLSHDNFFELNPQFSRNGGPPQQFKGESSEIVIHEAIRFVAKAKQNRRPFLAVVWFGSPHEPYSGLARDLALYRDLPESLKERFVELTGDKGLPFKQSLHEVLPARFAEITAMDRAIGQLRQYLAKEGLRQNTVLWYCGDNGVPGDGRLAMPLRGAKGRVYEGGVRVPGIIEWPEGIPKHRVTDVNAVTSDMLPTICDLVGQPVPQRPLDGVSLKSLLDGSMKERPKPICFWSYDARRESRLEPYISPQLQEGTTPLVKAMDGRFTRNFRNYRHPRITEQDFAGAAAILGNRYKLVVSGERSAESGSAPAASTPLRELFDLREDQGETKDLIQAKPEIAEDMGQQLRNWQQSVLASLTGADYR